MTALIKLTRARTRLLLRSPSLRTLVPKLKLIENNSQPTMGTTDGYTIVYNTNFVDSLSLDECVLVLGHEAAHCVFMQKRRDNHMRTSK